MERAKDRYKITLKTLKKAIKSLKEAIKAPLTSISRDAVIQRFEYTFEMGWKAIKLFGKREGFDCNSPRECIKIGYRMGWIDEPDNWFEMLKARNLTSHTYNEDVAQDVYKNIKKFPKIINALLKNLKETLEE